MNDLIQPVKSDNVENGETHAPTFAAESSAEKNGDARREIFGHRPEQFVWATGIEDTFVVQRRKGHRSLDEYELLGHYDHWREDLSLAKNIGFQAIRWGIPWHRVEPEPGKFDWSWTDQVIPFIVEELGIIPIIDLMHYGCPPWVHKEFANKDYPLFVAQYAKAFAEHYRSLVRYYTPLNEPVVNALWCGKRGVWPPYLRGDAGYIRIMLQLARGIQNTIDAIKEVDPESVMVHVEATGLSRAASDELKQLALEDTHKDNLCLDLLSGRLVRDHPLNAWLIRNGVSIHEVKEITDRGRPFEILGLNFYPQWSTRQLYIDARGRLAYRAHEQDGAGFGTMIHDLHTCYQCPIMITETSAFGSDELRAKWLSTSVMTVKELREKGIPVLGYTWFPLFTMIDWRYRFGRGPKEQYRMELGLYKLAHALDLIGTETAVGERWKGTELIERFQRVISDPSTAIGNLNPLAKETAVCT
ncbi:MAG TPA: family 1 glycosylhydrolase [Candidatus Kapabacteria bacterium]|jgi:beta-glucosidase/6-phospho-beta-glucosidase/beta-galactosidase